MSAKHKNALGRGLGALLDDSHQIQPMISAGESPSAGTHFISVDCIEGNPFQPRTDFDQTRLSELADSIKVHGVIQPVTVRKLSNKNYQLISGERRWQAASLAGLKEVPAFVRKADDQQMLEMALIENIQRENLNAIEVGLSYQRLISECNLKQEELGTRVGKNRSTVTNYIRLLKLPPDIQAGIRDGKLSMGHARALLSLENSDHQLVVYKKIVHEELNVRQVEKLVKKITSGRLTSTQATAKNVPAEIKQLKKQLSTHFGAKVSVQVGDNNKGKIQIPFISVQDLNRILDILEIRL